MDLKLIFGCVFTIVCALVATVYKEPRSYEALIKPVLSRVAGWIFLIAIGTLIGYMAVSNALMTFIDPARMETARKAADEIMAMAYLAQLFGALLWVLDIGLSVLADKAVRLKSKE